MFLQAEMRAAVFLAMEEQDKLEVSDSHRSSNHSVDQSVLSVIVQDQDNAGQYLPLTLWRAGQSQREHEITRNAALNNSSI